MKTKTISGAVVLFLFITAIFQAVYAANIITHRTGAVKITKPDGTVLTVEKDGHLPDIPSGAVVEILDGGMDVTPAVGFIQVVAGNSVATVKTGDRVAVFIDSATGMARFKVYAGKINIVAVNTTVTVRTNQHVQIGLDERTGTAEVRSIKGVIETVTVGVKVSVPEGAIAKIRADARTRTVHVESEVGVSRVISIDGKVTIVAEGKSIDMLASAIGEIQTFPGEVTEVLLPREEPAEPERPEGSEYRP